MRVQLIRPVTNYNFSNKLCGEAATIGPLPDLESGVRVTCNVGYLCASFSPRPLFST